MKKWLVAGLAAIPVLYYALTVVRYAYNFPYMDDYPVIVDFLNRLPNAHTFGEKVALLLEQNNFHRLVLAKLIAWADVALTGSVDFRIMQYVGLAALLGTAWLLWRNSDAIPPGDGIAKVRLAYFLPVLFLLFQFQGWNVAFWSIVATSNAGAPALALLAFHLAHRGREGWAVGVGVVALFTNGNGILVLPLLTAGWLVQQRWRLAAGTLVGTLGALLFYFQNYQNPSGTPLMALFSPEKVLHLLALDTAFLGALVYHPAVPWLPILVGSLTIGWMLYLIWTRYDCQNPTLFWLLIFLHLTGLMLAVNRIQNDTSIVFASRYRNITALHLAVTYLSMFSGETLRCEKATKFLSQRRVSPLNILATLTTAALWLISNLTYQSKIERFRELKQTDNLLWRQVGQVRGCAPQYDPVRQLGIMAKRQTFRPDERDQSLDALPSRPVLVAMVTTPGDSLQYKVDVTLRRGRFLLVSGGAKVAGRKANFNDTYLGVKSATGWQYYTTLFHQRLDNEDSANDKDTGFTAIVPVANVPDSLTIFVKSGRFAAKRTMLNRAAD